MGSFGKKFKGRCLGVDIGTSNLKVIELNSLAGQPNLATYGSIGVGYDLIRSESKEVQEKIFKSLKKIIKESGVKSVRAIASLPGFSVFTTVLNLPKMKEKELASAIKWEAKRYIPFPIEEIILDWEILGSKNVPIDLADGQIAESKEELEVFLTAVPKNIVGRYSDIFKSADLKLIGLEPEAMALSRALVGRAKGRAMIVDLGATATEICIVEDGHPKLNLSVDTGGNALTKAIAQSLQVSFNRAEQFKRDFGVSRRKLGGEIPRAIRPVIDIIVEKIQHCLGLFYNRGGGKISRIILSGGSARLPEFVSYLSLFLKEEKIEISNPWQYVLYPKELDRVLQELGPGFDVAVGLALSEFIVR